MVIIHNKIKFVNIFWQLFPISWQILRLTALISIYIAWAPGRGQAIAPTLLRAGRHVVHSRGDGLSSPSSGCLRTEPPTLLRAGRHVVHSRGDGLSSPSSGSHAINNHESSLSLNDLVSV